MVASRIGSRGKTMQGAAQPPPRKEIKLRPVFAPDSKLQNKNEISGNRYALGLIRLGDQ